MNVCTPCHPFVHFLLVAREYNNVCVYVCVYVCMCIVVVILDIFLVRCTQFFVALVRLGIEACTPLFLKGDTRVTQIVRVSHNKCGL